MQFARTLAILSFRPVTSRGNRGILVHIHICILTRRSHGHEQGSAPDVGPGERHIDPQLVVAIRPRASQTTVNSKKFVK